MLLPSPRNPRTPITGTGPSSKNWGEAVEVAQATLLVRAKRTAAAVALEVLAALLALLFVVSFVLFFYLVCLPWMGVH
jgi:hypothetical protein